MHQEMLEPTPQMDPLQQLDLLLSEDPLPTGTESIRYGSLLYL